MWSLKIKFEIIKNNHDGYCSDPGYNYKETSYDTKYFDVDDLFIDKYVEDDGTINNNFEKIPGFIEYVDTFNNHYNKCCGSTYNIISGKLEKSIKKQYQEDRLREINNQRLLYNDIPFTNYQDYIKQLNIV